METYLSDAFINTTSNNEGLKKKFIENHYYYKKNNFPLSKIFDKLDWIQSDYLKQMKKIVYHNLSVVRGLYKNTLDIEFLPDLDELHKAIRKRHDLVHRNGKDKKGTLIEISKNDITKLISEVTNFVRRIDDQLTDLENWFS